MSSAKRQQDARRKRGGVRPFWLGMLTGLLLAAIIFHRLLLELLVDASDIVLPVITMPGLLELTVGFIGFGIVLLVNHLLRREQDDEWVVLDDGEDKAVRAEGSQPEGGQSS